MTVKRTAAETRAHIAALESEIKILREREADPIAEYWDAHAITAVFDLCERCGFRPKSRSPQDIEEAAESILLKYPR